MSLTVFNIGKDPAIIFIDDDDAHTYLLSGNVIPSVSKVKGWLQEPFDAEKISREKALKELKKEYPIEFINDNIIEINAAKLREEWNGEAKESQIYGTEIHEVIEDHTNKHPVDNKYLDLLSQLDKMIFSKYQVLLTEKPIYHKELMIGGTSDIIGLRERKTDTFVDVFDYKTNLKKGVRFDSTYYNVRGIKSNTTYKRILTNVEQCNYFDTVIQLNCYAEMLSHTYNAKIGKLAMIFIDIDLNPHYHPIPYIPGFGKMIMKSYRDEHIISSKPLVTFSESHPSF